ncbi:hypothetical protein GE21DRAFT_6595 [Neurospora crassa]|uniref:Prp 4 CRoW domain-containing protein n=2 Tax=Neurospora crassa TaxID=5141 RepID=Q1K645_NEUCR|nr:hypothetical protein NCU09929 [Neurospora crassa OR74A]EAA28979.1 hypothetical protein NCU09929 [Neurospora crassa OR74A]KAK3491739.1 hypothetical protein B0T13DRAFT_60664 [Neurospora crassa]KHE84903.1 hypothetical protein GE21DRAFT_6595 [Neurospora crassa]CAB91338.1 conserved hypothetical protein [Neurospora crassa]|eukprot:XP_958215.1 hypothetical protein NCU09929 [Neurospora crassa OR74A]
MHVKSFTALAALALAAQAVAEPIRLVGAPYKAASKIHKTSVRQLFGVVRRQDNPGYQPEQTVCGTGNTCAEACGAGFEACASKDDSVHCYNAGAAQICCPNGSGNSCDAGYYCAADAQNETWCCPDGMSLEQCAAAYKVDGSLVSQTAEATSTSTSSSTSSTSSVASSTSTSSTVVSTTSTSSVVVSTTSTSSVVVPLTTSSVALTTSSAPAITVPAVSSSSIVLIPTGLATGGAPSGANGTSVVVVSPQPTQSEVAIGAGSVAKPAGAFLLVAAGLAALL